ncbi:NLR family CARD domain-containing protein 4-like [Asterias amurensis]|uniref:NLR family CARD domain-containing protein 4-like n=1 Tax=Asterias amurensis TaxID=7602 RepID=UPI003AB5283C
MAAFTDNTTDSTTTTTEGQSGLTTESIIAIVFGCIGAVGVFFGILGFLYNWRRNRREDDRRRRQEDHRRHQQENIPLTQPTEGKPDPDQFQAVGQKANEALKKKYTNTGSYVQMLPLVDDDKSHITDIYTKLCLNELVDTRGKIQHKKIDSYEEIFHFQTIEGNPIKRIVVSGSAGIGKTTLIDKIAYDWAMGNSETLNKFKLVFALKMRSLKISSNLTEAIFNTLLDNDTLDQSASKEFVDKNQDKVLILLDGFDEFKIDPLDTSSFGSILNILNQNRGPECWVVITSRSPLDKLVNKSLVKKPYAHVRVEGFSDTDKEEYVNKFFNDDHVKASKLTEQIKQSETLSDLAKSPMLLLLMCLLMGSTENTLPDTMTRLYNKALKYIFKRKTRDIKDAAISKILISIGKVALDRLISTDESFAFREGDFKKSALDAAINAGVLNSEMVIDGLDIYQRVSFMHHTFLEYCAAMYWQSLMNTEEFDRILDQIESIESKFLLTHSYDYLLQFCCGDNEACTNRILQKVHEVIEPRLVAICYLESQPKELPPKNIIRSVLAGEDEDDDVVHLYLSDNELFYFLKCVTTLSRGNDYFTNVKKLVVGRLSFQKFGEDLAKSIKLMTNLQSLSLKDSSLSAANTNQILSSLASPSTLTELDLSGSRALGGSVSLLAPQLMKLKRLKELHLVDCSLEAQDVSPIVKSTGDTLVNLDVSWNRALGGCASIWGPELGEMECLQDINFEECLLQGTDIEPIAVALSGVSTVANLDLSSNYALGGGALLWAQHLKKIRHLKKLTLEKSWLKDCDMKPISESVSDMPILVHLNLSENEALGGCASSWALHLKKMILLEELILKGCNLTDCDVKPIAESLSGKCTLAYLDISSNYALGGCASSWAQHLRKISHLQKLKLQYVKQEDMEPIAESVSDLPNFTRLDLTHSLSDGHASLWALHLKKMSHLQELVLEWCYLQYDDIEPIAESVSDMPNLICLDLTMNDNLGGGASLWAQHLRKMSHLKELKLERCNLSDKDMEPIAEAVSDMPNLVRLDLSKNRYLHHCASLWAPHLKQMIKHLKELKMYRCLLTEKDH